MFNLDENALALESLLDEAVNEMDSLIADDSDVSVDDDDAIAVEAFFSKPKSAEELVERAAKSISKKCKTVEDCDEMLAKLNTEASKFNASLKTMKKAAEGLRDGKIEKAEAKKQIGAARSELKKSCDLINFGKIVASSNDVSDADIQKLKSFITGLKAAIQAKKKELGASSQGKAVEGFLSMLEDEDMDVATEGRGLDAFKLSHSENFKGAKAAYKSARSKIKSKDFDGAIADIKLCEDKLGKIEGEVKALGDSNFVGTIVSYYSPFAFFMGGTWNPIPAIRNLGATDRYADAGGTKNAAIKAIKLSIAEVKRKLEKLKKTAAAAKSTGATEAYIEAFESFYDEEDLMAFEAFIGGAIAAMEDVDVI